MIKPKRRYEKHRHKIKDRNKYPRWYDAGYKDALRDIGSEKPELHEYLLLLWKRKKKSYRIQETATNE